MTRRFVVPIAVAIWVGVVGSGMAALTHYKSTPGAVGEVARQWPAASALEREAGALTLIMAVHPKCVCSRASLDELVILLGRAQKRVAATVLLTRPEGSDPSWSQSDIRTQASRIPGARVVDDEGGREARRFGALTSGQVFLYAADGQLVFHGGLTGGRGHEGDNAGLSRALGIVDGTPVARAESPVFGCALFDSTSSHGGGN